MPVRLRMPQPYLDCGREARHERSYRFRRLTGPSQKMPPATTTSRSKAAALQSPLKFVPPDSTANPTPSTLHAPDPDQDQQVNKCKPPRP